MTKTNQIVVIGLDGAAPNLIERWKEDLPNFQWLINNGISGGLESTIPPVTCPAWISFATGKNPGKLGLYEFIDLDSNRKIKVANSTVYDAPTIWEVLSKAGKRVCIVNVPVTYPPVPVNGFLVSSFLTPPNKKDYTYPLELRDELDKVVNGYEITSICTNPSDIKGGEKALLSELERIHYKRLKVTEYLMKNYSWDFFMVVFRSVDIVQHHFWHHMDKSHRKHDPIQAKKYGNVIKDWYIKMDEAIGRIREIIEHAPNDTYLFIMSDHGFGPSQHAFYLNNWLIKQRFLKINSKEFSSSSKFSSIKKSALKYVPPKINRLLLDILPPILTQKVMASELNKQILADYMNKIDWKNTKAFALGGLSGRIYITAAVSKDDYENVRDEIIKKFRMTKYDDEKSKIQFKIYKKEEVYWGNRSDTAPDIVIELFENDLLGPIKANITPNGKLWGNVSNSGVHQKEGILFIAGPSVLKNKKMNAKIIDLAPTMLHLLNAPIPADVDGKVLNGAFSFSRQIEYKEVPRKQVKTQEYSKMEKNEIMKRLHDLGYI